MQYTLQVIIHHASSGARQPVLLLLHSSRTPIFPCIVPNAPSQGLWIPCNCWYLQQRRPIVSTQRPATTALVEPCGMDQSPTCDPHHRHGLFSIHILIDTSICVQWGCNATFINKNPPSCYHQREFTLTGIDLSAM